MDWNLVGAFLGAVILTAFLIAAGHRSSRGQRIALIGLGLAIFAVPTYLGSVVQDRANQTLAEERATSSEARVQARFDQLSGQLDQAFRGILEALGDPNKSPEQRRLAVAAAVGRYNEVVTRLRSGPIEPLEVPAIAGSETAGSQSPPSSDAPAPTVERPRETQSAPIEDAAPAPVFVPPPPVVVPPPVMPPPSPPPPPPPPP